VVSRGSLYGSCRRDIKSLAKEECFVLVSLLLFYYFAF